MRPDPTILAFDTSAAHVAAALLRDGAIRTDRLDPMQRGQAEALLPTLEDVLAANGISWGDLDAIAVGVGPGNFTGIRIAVSAAKGLSLSLGVPAVGVTMFDVLTYQTAGDNLLASLRAPRDKAYVQTYRNGEPEDPPRLISLEDPPNDLQLSSRTKILGHRAIELQQHFDANAEDADLVEIAPRIARIAEIKLQNDTATAPSPLYVRPPDAAPAKTPPPTVVP